MWHTLFSRDILVHVFFHHCFPFFTHLPFYLSEILKRLYLFFPPQILLKCTALLLDHPKWFPSICLCFAPQSACSSMRYAFENRMTWEVLMPRSTHAWHGTFVWGRQRQWRTIQFRPNYGRICQCKLATTTRGLLCRKERGVNLRGAAKMEEQLRCCNVLSGCQKKTRRGSSFPRTTYGMYARRTCSCTSCCGGRKWWVSLCQGTRTLLNMLSSPKRQGKIKIRLLSLPRKNKVVYHQPGQLPYLCPMLVVLKYGVWELPHMLAECPSDLQWHCHQRRSVEPCHCVMRACVHISCYIWVPNSYGACDDLQSKGEESCAGCPSFRPF